MRKEWLETAAKGVEDLLGEDLLGEISVLPFDVPAEAEYRAIRSKVEAAGQPIGGNELLIAAHAQAMGAAIVTAGALLENPQEGGTGQAEGEPAN